MFVLPMYNIMLTNQSIVLVYPRPIKLNGTFFILFYVLFTFNVYMQPYGYDRPFTCCDVRHFLSASGVSPE